MIFVSKFHSDKNLNSIVEFGRSIYKDNRFYNHMPEKIEQVNNGFHISLHPKRQVMHFRRHSPGQIIFKRNISWFPVVKPFHLLSLFTLPLELCKNTEKQTTFITPVDEKYKDSLFLKVDIFPRNTTEHQPYDKSIFVLGYCPDYLVRASLMLAKQRTPALIYWPEDNILEL